MVVYVLFPGSMPGSYRLRSNLLQYKSRSPTHVRGRCMRSSNLALPRGTPTRQCVVSCTCPGFVCLVG